MEIETKELEYCKLEALYKADPDTVSLKRDEIVADFRNVQIPGFRKGKAPDYAIKAKLKKHIDGRLLLQMKEQAYDDLIFEKNMKTIGYPSFSDVNLNGNKFSCKLTVIQKPEFELKNYKYEIPTPDIDRDVNPKVEKFIQELRMNFADLRTYEDGEFVDVGDQVTLDFTSTIDGEVYDGSVAEGQLYTVGSNGFQEFDDNLLGMVPGETREFDVTFPEKFPNIGGKTAHFSLTVHMGTKKVPHALDDELAKKCGMNSLDELNEKVLKIEESKVKQAEKFAIREQVVNRLVNDNEFKVPDILVDMDAQFSASRNSIDWYSLEEAEKDAFRSSSMKSVRLSLILDALREKEADSVLNDVEALNSLKRRAELHGQDPNKTIVEAEKNGSLMGMLTALKDEFTIQWVVDQATIIN